MTGGPVIGDDVVSVIGSGASPILIIAIVVMLASVLYIICEKEGDSIS